MKQNTRVYTEIQGQVFKVHVPTGSRKGGGKRSKVRPFMSDASRRRLMEKFARLDLTTLENAGVKARFVTLTTPPEYWNDEKAVYQALDKFRRWCERQGGYLGAVVRRERGERRGMLHFHMIIFGVHWLPEGQQRDGFVMSPGPVEASWRKSLSTERDLIQVSVQMPECAAQIQRYIAKYCVKVAYEGKERTGAAVPEADATARAEAAGAAEGGREDVPLTKAHNAEQTGRGEHNGRRWWYVWGVKSLPWAICEEATFDDAGRKVVYAARRVMRRWAKVRAKAGASRRIAREMYPSSNPDIMQYVVLRTHEALVKKASRQNTLVRYLSSTRTGFTVFLPPEEINSCLRAGMYAVI